MILIGGGSRSGKTAFALNLARSLGTRLAYVATAELLDDEMKERARAHRQERGSGFLTIEESRDLIQLIETRAPEFDAMVIDCLTLWLSSIMLSGGTLTTSTYQALAQTAAQSPTRVIFVTNEVGCGIIPANALARQFSDHAGWLNQAVAAHAAEVYWMVFGQPLKVKG